MSNCIACWGIRDTWGACARIGCWEVAVREHPHPPYYRRVQQLSCKWTGSGPECAAQTLPLSCKIYKPSIFGWQGTGGGVYLYEMFEVLS